jgi:hypothetical protein
MWRGELDLARGVFVRLLALADERGDALGDAHVRTHLCELDLRAGQWGRVASQLDESSASEWDVMTHPILERYQAHLAVGRGLPAEAERWAKEELDRARAISVPFHELDARRTFGMAHLISHRPERAVESLRSVWEHCEREGVEEPGVFPVAPDLVEALVELGQLDEAQRVTSRLRGVSEEQEHPWGLATAKLCEGTIELVSDYGERPVQELEQAAADYDRLGLGFDVAELAGDGLANKEIAQALFVSVKTVEGHLSHVYAKLGVRSRAQLAHRLSTGSTA